ncbi:fluoride efflux transporter CrcB [Actinopolyspora saharensis]|uniref:Fluoride-specific ion channel FluC n=1 Tax=Actinopolyspora saharensis TaxID=995062 RepID=A0A1H1FV96_9ACTN|nr:fluoride efflux transporter CrcB [Actinopolyspora saharensis]SDR04649.1 CrcB protein [Actinopolyspora saharensis]
MFGVVRVRARRPFPWAVVLAVALGGALGSVARYGVSLWIGRGGAGFPWGTLAVNVVGCLIIGAVTVLLEEFGNPHRLVRPFVGVGVLGGFTTFSTYVADVGDLLAAQRPVQATVYLFGTVALGVVSVVCGAVSVRALAGRAASRARGGERS